MKKFKLPENAAGFTEIHVSSEGELSLHGPNGFRDIKKSDRGIILDPQYIVEFNMGSVSWAFNMEARPEMTIKYSPNNLQEIYNIAEIIKMNHYTRIY